MSEFYAPVDPDVLKRERAKSRELRASGWWKRRISDGLCYYCRRAVSPFKTERYVNEYAYECGECDGDGLNA